MTRGRPALLLLAAGLALAIPASAEAKLRFRDCDDALWAVLSVPLDHTGTVPGRLSLRVERRDAFGRGQHGVTLVLAGLISRVRGRVAGRRVRAQVRIPSRFADAFEEFEESGGR